MFKIGQHVRQDFGGQIMVIIDFEPELIENVITQWEDEIGNVLTGKFSEQQLILEEESPEALENQES
jgi:heat shock protein HspQ